jgi:cytochrome c oxidase subunit II
MQTGMTMFKPLFLAMMLAFAPAAVMAQTAAPTSPAAVTSKAESVATAPTTVKKVAPTPGIGQPISGSYGIQRQVTPDGRQAQWMHDILLMPIITAISLFVLGLLGWVAFRYRRAANPVASKNSHNTVIEIVWTLVPVLILVVISIPSIQLLAQQYKPAGKGAITVKATGNQWYWTYNYPDYGDFEVTSNPLSDADAKAAGEPRMLAVDNRILIPVNTPIKLITTSKDVIHSWAMPAFWTKMDAVPGRLNEVKFTVDREGVYYGQCSELCGARHGYMPIAVEVVSRARFDEWIKSKGGTLPGAAPAAAPAPAATTKIEAPVPAPIAPATPVAVTK